MTFFDKFPGFFANKKPIPGHDFMTSFPVSPVP